MPELMRVGIIYRDQDLEILGDLADPSALWRLELIGEKAVRDGSLGVSRGFVAVFFPAEDDGLPALLGRLFPGSELIAFETPAPGARPAPARRGDGLLVVQFPADFPVAMHLLGSYALAETHRNEVVRMRHRMDQLDAFLEAFINVIESSWDPGERRLGMNILVNRILAQMEAEECAIYRFDDGGTLQRAHCTGNYKDLDLFDNEANTGIVEKVLNTGKPYLNNDYFLELRAPYSKDHVVISSVLSVPLARRGEIFGVFELLNKRRGKFTEEDLKLAQSLAEPLTIAIRTGAMFEDSERLTITDDLTKLYNYRYLMQFLDAEVKRCLRYKKKVSLLFIDVDGFKRINDTFGHLVGSQALAETGQVLRRSLRETDVVGRYGGDEFVIVLPETPLSGAMVIAERIRKKVEDYEFVAQNVSVRLTVSLGVANCPKHTLTAEGLIKKADAAMYRAKELSKNSIKVAV
jgi:diguanylate cyclase (GGDEF)-like protein